MQIKNFIIRNYNIFFVLIVASTISFLTLISAGTFILAQWDNELTSVEASNKGTGNSEQASNIDIPDKNSDNMPENSVTDLKTDLENPANELKPVSKLDKSVNILFLVSDASSGCTDTMLILNYDPVEVEVSILSITRDTKVRLEDGKAMKINSVYAINGIDTLLTSIKNLLNIDIDYYFYFEIKAVRKVIDMFDGVDFYVPFNMYYVDPDQDLHINLKKGQQLLNGNKAEQLLRFRQSVNPTAEELQYYNGSDINRMDMQVKFIKEFVKQKANLTYFFKLNDVATYVLKNVKTNLALDAALEIILKMQNKMEALQQSEVMSFRLDGDYSTDGNWYFLYNGMIYNKNQDAVYEENLIKSKYFSD